jgi:hypothetical protein
MFAKKGGGGIICLSYINMLWFAFEERKEKLGRKKNGRRLGEVA